MENKKETIGSVWDVMPKRVQGTMMGTLLFLLAMASSNLLNLLNTDIFIINFSLAIIYVIGIFKLVIIIYPWLSNEWIKKDGKE